MYRNIYTGKTCKLDHIETVHSFPNDLYVYVLEDGSRWVADLFLKNWDKVMPEKKDKK